MNFNLKFNLNWIITVPSTQSTLCAVPSKCTKSNRKVSETYRYSTIISVGRSNNDNHQEIKLDADVIVVPDTHHSCQYSIKFENINVCIYESICGESKCNV